MTRARKTVLSSVAATLVVVTLLVVAALAWVPSPGGSAGRGPSLAAHPVGVTSVNLGDLPALAWYPAAASTAPGGTWYHQTMRMDPSMPELALARFRGVATHDASWAALDGPAPLVLVSPGFATNPEGYAWLGEALASRGFVVVAIDHREALDPATLYLATVDRPAALSAALDGVEALTAASGHWDGRVSTDGVIAVGHSYGGYAVQAIGGARLDTSGFDERCAAAREAMHPGVFLCNAIEPRLESMSAHAGLASEPAGLWPDWSDARVGAVVSLAGDSYLFGANGLAALTVPVVAIGGDADTPLDWGGELTAAHAGGDASLEVIAGGVHMDFVNSPTQLRLGAKWLPEGFLARGGDTSDASKEATVAAVLALAGSPCC